MSRTKSAGEQFWTATRDAGGELIAHTREAQKDLVDTMQGEAEDWLELLRAEGPKLRLEAFSSASRDGSPAASKSSARNSDAAPGAIDVRAVERKLLLGLEEALQSLEVRVHERLESLDAAALPSGNGAAAKHASSAKKNGKSKKPAEEAVVSAGAPIAGYDKLTAREVVGRAQRLDRRKVEALLNYERETKNRTTVVNALLGRLDA